MNNETELRKQICDIGRRIYERNMGASNDGNISIRLSDGNILCTPTGVSKGFMTPECICKVDMKGQQIEESDYRPSSEMKMHLRIYEKRPDVNAVVHAHPIYATSFAAAGIPLSLPVMSEAMVSLGCVPIAEFGLPSTNEVPDSIEKYLPYFDAVLLEHHGALTYAPDLTTAYYNMESVEFYAQGLYQVKMLGTPQLIEDSTIDRLYDLRTSLGKKGRPPVGICCSKHAAHCIKKTCV